LLLLKIGGIEEAICPLAGVEIDCPLLGVAVEDPLGLEPSAGLEPVELLGEPTGTAVGGVGVMPLPGAGVVLGEGVELTTPD